jgi:hypothetical protein
LVPGVASSRALVGTEFTFPTGYTKFSVTADIDWNYNLVTWVVFGGGGCGVDLVLRVEPGGGADAVEKTVGLVSLVAPALWGAGANGSGTSTLGLSLTLTDSASQDLKVFAGAECHAEEEGVVGTSDASVTGNVTRITVHAE